MNGVSEVGRMERGREDDVVQWNLKTIFERAFCPYPVLIDSIIVMLDHCSACDAERPNWVQMCILELRFLHALGVAC